MFGLAVISCIFGSVGVIMFILLILSKLNSGCLIVLFSLLLIGGYIGFNVGVGVGYYGASGVALANLVGIILGIIAIISYRRKKDQELVEVAALSLRSSANSHSSNSYSSSSSDNYSSSSSSANDYKCVSCVGHKPSGECFNRDSPRYNDITADDDSCTCWKKWSRYRG